MKKYILKKALPNLSKGAIFELRDYDSKHPDWGNPGCGCLILAWDNGNCQFTELGSWCGETYIFPGQLAENKEWFKEIEFRESKSWIMGLCWKGRKIKEEGIFWIPENEALEHFNRILDNR